MKNRMIVATLVALAGTAVGIALPTSPATADHCEGHSGSDDSGTDLEVNCPPEDNEGDPPSTPPDDGGDGPSWTAEQVCAEQAPGWGDCVTVVNLNGIQPNDMCGYVIAPDQSLLEYYQPDAPEGSVLMYNICPREGNYYTEDTQWAPANAPPTPEEVAADLWGAVQGRLLEPTVVASPAVGPRAIIGVPTFVAVTNWQDPIEETADAGGVGITLTATPTLSFDPGEPLADAFACTPPGTRFDPDGAELRDQARAQGACAYSYKQRTSVEDRPAEWPGQVIVTWEAEWEADNGESDAFDPVVLSADLDRAVDEVQSILTQRPT